MIELSSPPPKHTQIQGSVSTLAVKPWTQCLKGGSLPSPKRSSWAPRGVG